MTGGEPQQVAPTRADLRLPELPVIDNAPPERADAARNRRRILDAAARLLTERGVEAITMNAVAHAAGMGVGTVYRRFGDVSQLLFALLEDGERAFQRAFLFGPPPLGPGAPPAERLYAFLHAAVDRLVAHRTIMVMRAADAASPSTRFHTGPYRAMHMHVSVLLRQLHPEIDPAVLAHLLLAPFAPSLFEHLLAEQGATREAIKAALDRLLGLCVPDSEVGQAREVGELDAGDPGLAQRQAQPARLAARPS